MLISFVIASLITFLTSILFAVFVYLNGMERKANRLWGLFGISVALWSLGLGLMASSPNKSTAIFWLKYVHYVGAISIPTLFLHFVLTLLELENTKKGKIWLILSYSISIILLIANFGGILSDVIPKPPFNYYTYPGPLYLVFTIEFFVFVSYAQYVLFVNFRKASSIKRNQFKYLFFGMGIGFIGGSSAFFPVFNIPIFPWGMYFASFHVAIVSYAIVKYHLLDIKIAVTRVGIFVTLYTIVLGIPFYIGYQTNSWVLSTSVAVVFASLGPLVYRALQRKAENLILAEQRRYHKVLIQAARGMSRVHNLGKLLEIIVRIVKRTVKISFAAVFLFDKEDEIYRLKAIRYKIPNPEQVTLSYFHPFIDCLKDRKEPFMLEELPDDVKNPFKLPFQPSLIIPAFFEDKILGFLLLGEKLNKKFYTIDDINVFKILAQQTALAVENCVFMEEFRKAQEKVFNAEKLASIGGMADGVAHQLKNRLHHFALVAGEQRYEIDTFVDKYPEIFSQNTELHKTFKYLKDTSDSLILNVQKTSAIIQGILNFARVEEKETYFSEFSLLEVVNNAKELLNIKHGLGEFPLEVEINSSDYVYGVKAQMIEVMFNLLDNAYESAKERKDYHLKPEEKGIYKPKINLKISQSDTISVIKVSDNGMGMKEDTKKKIFAPFFTTKSSAISGSGIGMYVVRRMVEENHKGRIRFESEYGAGTTFTIELPKRVNKRGEEN